MIKEKRSFYQGQTLIKSARYFTAEEKGNPLKRVYEATESGEFKSMIAYAIDINTTRNSNFTATNIPTVGDYDEVNVNPNFKMKCYQKFHGIKYQ